MIRKVLLLGDFSAVHMNLAEGLRNLGIDAVDASYGNAWRQLDSSINFERQILGLPVKISRNISPFVNFNKLINNDIVQFIHYNNFNRRFLIDRALSKIIVRLNRKAFLVSTGCDYFTRQYFGGKYDYPELCRECLKHDQRSESCQFESESNKREQSEFLESIDGVIPLTYEYAESYREAGIAKLLKTIPMPINTEKVKYSENTVGRELVFFHGLNREGFKGTELIRQALENVRRRYPNDIKVIVEGKMPLSDYLKALAKSNVVVYQAYALTYGMNAVYSMALGKVVMGGGHPKGLAEYGVANSPVIAFQPNLASLEESIEGMIERRRDIPKMSVEARNYVVNVHHYELIAKKFLQAWAQC